MPLKSMVHQQPAQDQPSQPAADGDDPGGTFPMKVYFRRVTVKVHRKTPKYPFYRIASRSSPLEVVVTRSAA